MNILNFLEQLVKNNNREWFESHRNEFELAKSDLKKLVNDVIVKVSAFDDSVFHEEPKNCIFRIYRDVRFSNDKTPYKQFMSAFIAKGGESSQNAGYYIHFEPNNCFIGGGIYSPSPNVQQAVRSEIYFNSKEFSEIIGATSFIKIYGSLMDEKYSRIPKGFPPDFENGELLKYKHYVASCKLPDAIYQSSDIQQYIANNFKELYPLNKFLNRAISNA